MSNEIEYRPGLEDVPAAESAVSFIDGKKARLEYRGIAVEVLAKESCFEETAWLLLKGDLPDAAAARRLRPRAPPAPRDPVQAQGPHQVPARRRPPDGRPAGARRGPGHVLPVPATSPTRPKNWEAAVRLIAKLPTVVAAFAPHPPRRRDRSSRATTSTTPPTSTTCCSSKEPTPAVRKVLDACLILHAEHTMNASHVHRPRHRLDARQPVHGRSARRIGTLSGPLHGGANEEVLDMLDEIGARRERAGVARRQAARRPEVQDHGLRPPRLQGEGPAGDGAAGAGRARLRRDRAGRRSTRWRWSWNGSCAGIYGPKGIYPNVDFYSGIVYQALGIPTDLFTPIFAIARVAGWLAHWLEQLDDNRIFRPEQIYVGKHDVKYMPLEKRP